MEVVFKHVCHWEQKRTQHVKNRKEHSIFSFHSMFFSSRSIKFYDKTALWFKTAWYENSPLCNCLWSCPTISPPERPGLERKTCYSSSLRTGSHFTCKQHLFISKSKHQCQYTPGCGCTLLTGCWSHDTVKGGNSGWELALDGCTGK